MTTKDGKPESYKDFLNLPMQNIDLNLDCSNCGMIFSEVNTHTREGWIETQISGFCEDCFDDLFPEEVETTDDNEE